MENSDGVAGREGGILLSPLLAIADESDTSAATSFSNRQGLQALRARPPKEFYAEVPFHNSLLFLVPPRSPAHIFLLTLRCVDAYRTNLLPTLSGNWFFPCILPCYSWRIVRL